MRILCLLLAISFGLLLNGVVYADCPACSNGFPPLAGRASEGRPDVLNGRPAISVRIDGSLDTSPGSHITNANVYNAVQNGLSRWNAATDPAGNPARYNFDLRQTDGGAQITIIHDPTLKVACAQTTGPAGGPYVIHLPDGADLRSLEALTNTIEHELGHVYALEHPDSVCAGNSIMRHNPGKKVNGVFDPCAGTSRSLTPNDVRVANLASSTPTGAPPGVCKYSPKFGSPDPPAPPPPNDYVEPSPPYYYPTCYYYYYARDFETCSRADDGPQTCSYAGTRYYLDYVICY